MPKNSTRGRWWKWLVPDPEPEPVPVEEDPLPIVLSPEPYVSNSWLYSAPAKPSTEVTVTWEAAGDPTSSPVTETTACWSDDGGTTTYNNLNALVAAQATGTTLNLPAGDFILTATVNVTGNYSIAFVGATSGGDPATAVQQNSGQECFYLNSTNYGGTHMWIENLEIGAFTSDIAAYDFATNITALADYSGVQKGADGIFLARGGSVYVTNTKVQFCGASGFSASSVYEWWEDTGTQKGTREVSTFMVYDCEVFGCGNTSGEHLSYVHGVPFYAYRTVFRDNVSGGYCFKYDGEMAILNQCHIDAQTTTAYNRPNDSVAPTIDLVAASDMHLRNTFVRAHVGDGGAEYANRQAMNITARANAGGSGFSKRVPAWWEQYLTAGGTTNGTPNSRALQWKDGSLATPNETYSGAVSSYSAGTPSITLKQMAIIGNATGSVTNTTTSNYWRVMWNGENKTATKGDGTLVFTLSSAFSGTPSANELVTICEHASGPDTPYLNQDYWDSASGSNYMDSIKSGSALDKTAYANFALQLFEDSMIVVDVNDSITNGHLAKFYSSQPSVYYLSNNSSADLPATPCAGENSLGSWDRAGDGAILLDTTGSGFLGNEPSTDNYIPPLLFSVAGTSVDYENGTTTNSSLVLAFSTETGANDPYTPTVTKIVGGVDTTIADPDTTGGNWLPSVVSTTTTQVESAGATTIQVSSITGINSGDQIHISYPRARGGLAVHVTTVNGAPSGSTVTLTDALDLAIENGARVHCLTAAGSKPAYWLSIEDTWNNRRTA